MINTMKKTAIYVFPILFLFTCASPTHAGSATIPWNAINPAPNFTSGSSLISDFFGGSGTDNPGFLALAIILGGFVLLAMLVMGGYQMLTNPTNPQAQELGKARITYAIVGFLLLFSAFWIVQLLEMVFGINVVGTSSSGGQAPRIGGPQLCSPPCSLSQVCNLDTNRCQSP